jgi:hypothetical protein
VVAGDGDAVSLRDNSYSTNITKVKVKGVTCMWYPEMEMLFHLGMCLLV